MNRVVVLSLGGEFTHRLLHALQERGATLAALVVYLAPAKTLRARLLTPLRHLRLRRDPRLRRSGVRVVFTGPLNSARMKRDLRRLAPDAIVLARCGLVDDELLAIPTRGVVNVHPGLLPWIRGNSPFGNALLRDVPLGATAFRVDPGIDTGALLQRRLLPVRGRESLPQLRDELFRLWVEMTADWIERAAAAPLPAGALQAAKFPLCREIADVTGNAAVRDAVAAGRAKTLFDRWSPLCDPADLSLPAGAEADFLPRPAAR
jgi:methionyl-tRNA formyltransferase